MGVEGRKYVSGTSKGGQEDIPTSCSVASRLGLRAHQAHVYRLPMRAWLRVVWSGCGHSSSLPRAAASSPQRHVLISPSAGSGPAWGPGEWRPRVGRGWGWPTCRRRPWRRPRAIPDQRLTAVGQGGVDGTGLRGEVGGGRHAFRQGLLEDGHALSADSRLQVTCSFRRKSSSSGQKVDETIDLKLHEALSLRVEPAGVGGGHRRGQSVDDRDERSGVPARE
jgi:hypothetical protein